MAGRSTGLTGAAGEYYVAAELSLRGWAATVTIKNSPRIDVLARSLSDLSMVAIQTKTASPKSQFQLKEKDEHGPFGPNDWYVLVGLRESERPEFFVVPRHHVAAILWVSHRNWLARGGRQNPRRNLRRVDLVNYRDWWSGLNASALAAAYAGPEWVPGLLADEAHGLPPDHPGL